MKPIPSSEVKPVNRTRGLVLVEVIVAAVLLLTVLGVTVGTLVRASTTVARSEASARATALLNRKLAELRDADETTLLKMSEAMGTETVERPLAGRLILRWKRRVSPTDDGTKAWTVTYEVEWPAADGVHHVSATRTIGPAQPLATAAR